MEWTQRLTRFSPHLCDFCERVILRQIDCLTKKDPVIYYPQRKRRTPLVSEACALCKYILSVFRAKVMDLTEEEVRNASTTRAVCFPPYSWVNLFPQVELSQSLT